jgi:hypothetical protein
MDHLRAVLVDLAEPALGHHHLCGRHAASTTVPLGWTLVDSRSPEEALWIELPDDDDVATADVRVLHPASVRAPARADDLQLEPELELAPLPFPATVEPEPVVASALPLSPPAAAAPAAAAEVFARHADSEGSEALAAALAAATPLLSRAFSEIQAS